LDFKKLSGVHFAKNPALSLLVSRHAPRADKYCHYLEKYERRLEKYCHYLKKYERYLKCSGLPGTMQGLRRIMQGLR
jgi:hypothetical protein